MIPRTFIKHSVNRCKPLGINLPPALILGPNEGFETTSHDLKFHRYVCSGV